MRRIRRSDEARKDVDEAVIYYSRQNLLLANRFIAAYELSLRSIAEMPSIGSLRFAHYLDVADLRTYPMPDFPYLIFYRELERVIQIDRVLHSHRDTFDILLGLE